MAKALKRHDIIPIVIYIFLQDTTISPIRCIIDICNFVQPILNFDILIISIDYTLQTPFDYVFEIKLFVK